MSLKPIADDAAERNWRRFVIFRVLFNARFYYPVLAVLFLDLGLSPTQYTLLNFAWALAIIFSDLPAGVLADRIGRKPLIVAAAGCMVAEMCFLIAAPTRGGTVLLLCCLANRILSGIAEGMASGADEALVFDSLAVVNRSQEWPHVLAQVMRWQSAGMVVAMLIGGAVYDATFMKGFFSFFGVHVYLTSAMTLRFPIYLNLITAILTLGVALGMREPSHHFASSPAPVKLAAWDLVTTAGSWILKTPVALFVIMAGIVLDSVTRLFMTFSSSYFREISVPEVMFGLIGAAMGSLGILVAPIARKMVAANTVATNYALMAVTIFAGVAGAALRWKYWGVIFMLPLGSAMMMLGYIVSYYLNALANSDRRATILSFKGLATNLAYGFISLVFALVLRAIRDGGNAEDALARGLVLLPLWLIIWSAAILIGFWRQRSALCQHAASSSL